MRQSSQKGYIEIQALNDRKRYGFQIDWNGSVVQQIDIKSIDWKKVPDDQECGTERVIAPRRHSKKEIKKPFWKFWWECCDDSPLQLSRDKDEIN
ncbi:hypothetical protein [Pollutibacter soli]|uniref:hypothetical protein n=1 Tax=Pollutibacter soli TaxID=3034157 RepID=UPI003013DCA5